MKECLHVLETAMSSDSEDLQELVSVSFLENLAQAGDDYEEIRQLLGPNLKQELRHYENEQGQPFPASIHPTASDPRLSNLISDMSSGSTE